MSKTDENDEDIKNGDDYEPIDYERMFKVFESTYREPLGGAHSANRETIEWVSNDNLSRIGGRGTKSGRCMGLARKDKKRT